MVERGKVGHSLYRLLLFRLLVLLIPLALATLFLAYRATLHYTNEAFDRSLARRVYALADQVEVLGGKVLLDLTGAAHSILEFDPTDIFYYRVVGPNGEHLSGTQDLPIPDDLRKNTQAGQLVFYDTELDSKKVRIVSYRLSLKGTSARGNVMILAGETTAKRRELADDVLLSVFLPMIAIVGLMVYAVSLALSMSLKPVNAIREAIARRGSHDLEPIEIQKLPAEIEPLLEEMNRLMSDLRTLHDSRQRFLADSAHQLRTPLASMRAQTELALRGVQDQGSQVALNNLLASLDRQSRLVNQLLTLSRAENALADPVRNEIRLEEVARNVTAEWVPRALERKIEIAFEAPKSASNIRGSAHSISEALANLLDNALRYCSEGDQVTVKVYVQDGYVCLAVSDTGKGVPDEALQKLFNRFYRVPGSQEEGCGLGLAIVKQVAMAYEGEVGVINRPEGGLEVSMCFPQVAESMK